MRGTPDVFRKIGFHALPMTYTQDHLKDALVNADDDHLGETLIKRLPEALDDPIAIIDSDSHPGRIVAIVEIKGQTRNTIAALEIDGTGTMHGKIIDSNAILTAHSRDNAISKLLLDAVQSEHDGKGGIYYWQKNKAISLARFIGVQFPVVSTITDGFVRSISDPLSKVNMRIEKFSDTKQFKRWFKGSKAVKRDRTPRILYHWTDGDFTVFDPAKSGNNQGMTHGDGIYLSTSPDEFSYAGKNRMDLYAAIRNPFEMQLSKKQAQQV